MLDLRSGLLRYCNGGHNPPRLLRADARVEVVPPTGNLVLGVVAGHEYRDAEIQLDPGDALFLYTDGITEAENAGQEEFGEARLDQTLAGLNEAPAGDIVKTVVDAVQTFAGDAPQSDDITCVAARLNATLS